MGVVRLTALALYSDLGLDRWPRHVLRAWNRDTQLRLDLSTERGQEVYDQVMKDYLGLEAS